MELEQIKVGFMDVFCYLVACPVTKETLLIDPGGHEEQLVERISQKGLKLKYIVNTHGHADHTCGNAKIKELTGAEIVMHGEDSEIFTSPAGQERSRQKIRYFDLNSFDLSCATPVKVLDINADLSGNVTNNFIDYTQRINRNLIGNAYKKTSFLMFVPDDVIDLRSRYPESTICNY